MPALQIKARFPLGVYRGHVGRGGALSAMPETSRLFRALVHAAGTGSTAIVDGRHLRPSDESIEALTWLEENPPVALVIPDAVAVNSGRISYRAEGVFEGSANRTDRKVRKIQSDGVAVAQSSGWEWRWEAVPSDIAATIKRLADEVSCLGESESIAVLETSSTPVTHEVVHDVGRLTPGPYTRVSTPMPGHFHELEDAHRAAHPNQPPKRDSFGWSGRPGAIAPPQAKSREVAYRAIGALDDAFAPWPFAVHVPVVGAGGDFSKVTSRDHVRLASAMHAALAAHLGDDAPAVVTGRYASGVKRPANRVAIHVPTDPAGTLAPGFLLLLPLGIDDGSVARLRRAVVSIRSIYCGHPRGSASQWRFPIGEPAVISGETFWPKVTDGHQRLWSASPALVPEVTRQGREWTLEDAVLLSLGFVCRDELEPVSGKSRYRDLVEQVRHAGARVRAVQHLPDSRTEDFVHRMTKGVPVRPLRTLVDVGGLIPDQALFALGQSRHLGGGFMHPVDVASGEGGDRVADA